MANEWIEHDGKGCPYPDGTPVEVVFSNGIFHKSVVSRANEYGRDGNYWVWDSLPIHAVHLRIIRYRLHDDGSEATRRAERMADFQRMADDALKGIKPVRAPKKERV